MLQDRDQLLHCELQRLKVRYPEVPDLADICSRLDIAISYVEHATHPTLGKDGPVRFQIRLPSRNRGTSYERFSIAHELAHYFLLASGDTTPATKSEYWKLETICDKFARDLLVPADFANDILAHTEKTPAGMLAASDALAAASRTPWLHVARWLSAAVGWCWFLRISLQKDARLIVSGSSFPKNAEQSRRVRAETPFSDRLLRAMNGVECGAQTVEVSYGQLLKSGLQSLKTCSHGVIVATDAATARLAVVSRSAPGAAECHDPPRSPTAWGPPSQLNFGF